jgi:ABC-type nitrate/sulfonate/bicarbonate transport system ATPase subunit
VKPIVKIDKIDKSFGDGTVLNAFSLDIYPGEILVIMGASGAGKSTLLNLIAGLEKPDAGTITYDEAIFESVRVPFPFVFQESESLPDWLNVRENIALVAPDASDSEIDQILGAVELSEHAKKYPPELSGGMKQRLGIARALICRSKVVLMDEPFASLDEEMRLRLQNFLIDLQKRLGFTVVLVTHDSREAERMASRVVTLSGVSAS